MKRILKTAMVVATMFGFAACEKDAISTSVANTQQKPTTISSTSTDSSTNTQNNPTTSPSVGNGNYTGSIEGTWQENKIRLYWKDDKSGVIRYDTTYVNPFDTTQFVTFNTNGTCLLSSDRYYYINAPGWPKTPQYAKVERNTVAYASDNGKYVVKINSGIHMGAEGVVTQDTVSFVNANTILIHYTFDDGQYLNVRDAYFVKK